MFNFKNKLLLIPFYSVISTCKFVLLNLFLCCNLTAQHPRSTIQTPTHPTLTDVRNSESMRIQEQNNQIMRNLGIKPPPSQAEINASLQQQINAQHSIQIPQQIELKQEIVQLINEANSKNNLTSAKEYYSSTYFKNDFTHYTAAKSLLTNMLENKTSLSIKDAYYCAEYAYGNLHLTFEEYNNTISKNTHFIRQWLKEQGYDLKNPEALHYGIQKFISDTLYITINGKREGHLPYYYDYIDVLSEKDRKNYFVTKTIATGSGQCHTFPVLYMILAESLGVEAFIAYNPQHSFIRFKNNKGTLINYETTVDYFLPDAFYLETLPVMADAYRNKLYINNLSRKQIVASIVFDLAVNFIEEHWLSDKSFIKECITLATPYFENPDYMGTSSFYLKKRLYADELNSLIKQKGIKNIREIEAHPEVLEVYTRYYNYMENVRRLGVQDFPKSEYLRMLEYYDHKSKIQVAKQLQAKTKKSLFIN
jgi:hypothetical protein